ncbi:sigma-70 family RNA polymerase sigma factor [Kribbella swartbergensis]
MTARELPSPTDRGRRDAATRKALIARERCPDEDQRRRWFLTAIELNLGLAREIMQRFRGHGVDDDDLEQIARLGLVKAALNYDAAEWPSFRAFARPTIEGELKRYFRDRAWSIRIPRRLRELQPTVTRCSRVLATDLQRTPTPAEVASRLGLPVEEVAATLDATRRTSPISLDRLVDVAEPQRDELAEAIRRLEDRDLVRSILRHLEPRDALVLRLRFLHEWTQSDISTVVGISQVQVSRIIRQALRQARAYAVDPR